MGHFVCQRCAISFETKGRLSVHLNKKIPCDYLCKECGIKLSNPDQYTRHIKNCTGPTGQTNVVENSNNNNSNNSNNNSNNSPIINGNDNVIVTINNNQTIIEARDVDTRRIAQLGILPLEAEQPELLEKFSRTLYTMFVTHMGIDKYYEEPQLKRLLLQIIELFHSNKQYPEYVNIVERSPNSDEICVMIYTGNRFENDPMSKLMRNKRVLQLVLKQIEQFILYPNMIIQNRINPFCTKYFIPFICKSYANDSITPEFQVCWQNNKRILDAIQYTQYPSFSQDQLTDEIIDKQLEDYHTSDKAIMGKIADHSSQIIETQIQEIKRKRLRSVERRPNPFII